MDSVIDFIADAAGCTDGDVGYSMKLLSYNNGDIISADCVAIVVFMS
jgi:hypothetical protein